MRKVVPVFEQKGNEFFVCHRDFLAEDEWGAMEIGWGASLVEAILWGVKFTGHTVDVTDGVPHIRAELAGTHVALLKGPLFDEQVARFPQE